ncbi:MAG: CYTH domain-containing protein [Burkholderiales bacterium]|nr:CYTH domain-containing protein [Burkholderiales bacterium]
MQEIELKFQIPADSLGAVAHEIGQIPGHRREHLQAHYFDTPDRQLGTARMALRLRKEGDVWVQTLKAGGSNTMVRLEDNRPTTAPTSGGPARVDLNLHQGVARDALIKALGWQPDSDPQGRQTPLTELYRTDIWRETARVAVGTNTAHAGIVELALDLGHILAGSLSVPVRELEIELVEGDPMAVIEAARAWVARHQLWLNTQTKAHRGDHLARQAADCAAPSVHTARGQVKAAPANATLDQAWRNALENALEQITGAMSELASAPPHANTTPVVRQWHIGLRRLRRLDHLMVRQGLNFLHATHQTLPPLLATLRRTQDPATLARQAAATVLCLDGLAALFAPPPQP